MPPTENRLLAALPLADFSRLTARMTDVTLAHRQTVYRADGPIDYVYFPRSGVISSVVTMLDGASVEVAAVGFEGILGGTAFLGAVRSREEVFCQVAPAACRKMPVAEFATEVNRGGALRDLVQGHLRAALAVSAQFTACNCLHSVEERCARWLLMCHDRAGTAEFPLTHEFLATMLGVRRATVTVTAGRLQSAGLITYRHGRVKIIARTELEQATCECYQVIRDAYELPTP